MASRCVIHYQNCGRCDQPSGLLCRRLTISSVTPAMQTQDEMVKAQHSIALPQDEARNVGGRMVHGWPPWLHTDLAGQPGLGAPTRALLPRAGGERAVDCSFGRSRGPHTDESMCGSSGGTGERLPWQLGALACCALEWIYLQNVPERSTRRKACKYALLLLFLCGCLRLWKAASQGLLVCLLDVSTSHASFLRNHTL